MARFCQLPLLALASLVSMVSAQGISLQIHPKPCKNDLGVPGTCMFVWDCIKTEGKHLGTCVDGFLFGSCCSHNDQSNVVPQPDSNQVISRPTIVTPFTHSSHSTPYVTTTTQSSKPVKPLRPSWSTSYITPSPTQHTSQAQANISTVKPPHRHTFKPPSGPVVGVAPAYSTRSTSSYTYTRPYTNFVTGRPSWKPHRNSTYPTTSIKIPTRKPVLTSPSSVSSTFSSKTTTHRIRTTTTSRYSTTKRTTSRPTWEPQAPFIPATTTRRTTTTRTPVTKTTSRTTTVKSTTRVTLKTTTKTTTTKSPMVTIFRPGTSVAQITEDLLETSKGTTARPVIPSMTIALITPAVTPRPSTTTSATTIKRTQRPTLPTFVISSLDTLFATRPTLPTRPPIQEPWKPITSSSVTSTAHQKITVTDAPVISEDFTETVPPEDISCGVPAVHPQKKVVGGKNSAFGSWPWQASVRRTSFFGFSSTHRCGGALISSQWVATAGHCVDDLMISQIKIRVGEYDFSSVQEPFGYVEKGVKRKVVHPRYNFFTYENDLALVQLEDPIDTGRLPHISPICLPPDEQDLVGKNATVTGWGRLSEGGVLPSILQEVQVPVISNEKCKNMFLAAGRHEYIPDIFMCAGFEEGGRDSCQGDSGGPLQIQADDGRWFLAGIISWGIGCAEPNMPGVCTRISKFKDWVLQNIT